VDDESRVERDGDYAAAYHFASLKTGSEKRRREFAKAYVDRYRGHYTVQEAWERWAREHPDEP
jgi:hypothetical protein